ncbi:replication protein A 70 kDa DNA-binding subunit-like isoform X3 [Acanthaster planci]|uniref:Replication protein A subunit n=1 Tax=Acanthaster planci TaxID=133434 RepID=A0A8B7ZHJ1_ACAPL|nr:replication protein A 70 kDa DNA-binding subunit-like isoform X3 [Acanthaster planci]
MSVQLSSGALEAINDGAQIDKPVFQLLALKKLNPTAATNNSVDRYRILLSDGVHNNTAMLAVQLNQMVTDGQLEPNTVICLDRYVCNKLPGNRRVVIILELTVAAPAGQVGGKIGNPVALPLGGATGANGQQAPAPQRPLQQQQAMRAGASPMSVAKANSFPGAGSNFSRQPQGSFGGPGPSSGMMSPPKQAQPISSLTPYQNRWTIKARVSSKSAVRTWSNSRGEGKLFSMDLCDQSGEIRATAFKDQCDKFFDLIEVGKVYFFSRGTLKTANRQYTSITNDYEMTFNNDTTVVPCEEEDDSIPTMQFDFRSINQLEEMNKDAILDVIGVVKSTGDVATITTKTTNRELTKRELQVMDDSNKVVTLTLWGNEAEKFDGTNNPVIAVKGARLSDFGGRSLSVLMSSTVLINPDIPRAHQLKGWYDSVGHTQEAQSISEQRMGAGVGASSNWLTLEEVYAQNLGQGEKPDYFTTKGTIIFMRKENSMYMACPSSECNKKVSDNGDGSYHCEKCGKDYPNFQHRLLLSANIADATDTQWTTFFQETAESILGMKADDLGRLKMEDEQSYSHVFEKACFESFIFRMRIKMESYNEEARLKCTCMSVKPIDVKEQSKKLIMDIRSLAAA